MHSGRVNSMKWFGRLVLVVAVVLVQGALIDAYLRSDVPPEPRAELGKTPARSRASGRDAGMPAARQRLDAFITKVAAYDFEQCAAALHEASSEDIDIVHVVGMQSSDPSPSLRFKTVLADRRVAKLYGWLAEMPPDRAAAKAASLFDEKLVLHEASWRREISLSQKAKRDEPLEEDAGEELPWTLHTFHALSAAQFLCGRYRSPTVVLETVDRWTKMMGSLYGQVRSDPELIGLSSFVEMQCLPEKLFVLNIYGLTYDRHGCGPVDRLLRAAETREPEFVKTPFDAWDADINDSDFLHVHGMVSADDTKILTHVWMARSWGSLAFDEMKQDEILAAARKLVEECARQHPSQSPR